MSAISLISPYAPQPVPATQEGQDAGLAVSKPVSDAKSGGSTNMTSDHSGQGAGNGTGTGGAQIAALLKRGRVAMLPVEAAPKSIVDAQAQSGPTAEYLAQQAELKAESKELQAAREADRMAERAAEAAMRRAEERAQAMPDPLPTAPILKRDDG